MSLNKRAVVLSAILWTAFQVGAAVPVFSTEPQGSQVVLNWAEFIKLWEDAHQVTPPPVITPAPFDYILSRAEYRGTVKPNATEITAEFEISVLNEDKWVSVPFLPASLGLKEAKLDGKTIAVAQQNGQHTLVIKGTGHHTLRAVFSIQTPDGDGTPRLNFPVMRTAMTLLTLTFPRPKLEITVDQAQVVNTNSENNQTTIHAILTPTEFIQASWQKQLPVGEVIPAKIYSSAQELLTVEESSVKINSQFTYSILYSGVEQFNLLVPDGVAVLGVSGEGVMDWKVEAGKNGQRLKVLLNQKRKGGQVLFVSAEIPLGNTPAFEVPFIRTLDVAREEGSIGLEAKSNVEVSIEDSKNIRQIDVNELPPDLWLRAVSPLLYGFSFNTEKAQLSFAVNHNEDVPVLTSTVDSGNAVTVLTKEGQWVTRVSYQVRNHLKQFIEVKLPAEAEIWSAFVAGRPVKPSKGKNGQILIPLEKSNPGNVNAGFAVELIYHMKGQDLGVGGNRNVFLPTIDLPISQVLWSVYVPEEFQFLHFGGNMEKERWATGIYPVLYNSLENSKDVRRDLPQDGKEQVYRERAYKIKGAMSRLTGDKSESKYDDELFKKQAALEIDAVRNEENGSLENHVLPIAFRIPEVGRLYRFGKIMVTGSTPTVKLSYVQSELVKVVRYLVFGFFFFLLFKVRRQVFEKVGGVAQMIILATYGRKSFSKPA